MQKHLFACECLDPKISEAWPPVAYCHACTSGHFAEISTISSLSSLSKTLHISQPARAVRTYPPPKKFNILAPPPPPPPFIFPEKGGEGGRCFFHAAKPRGVLSLGRNLQFVWHEVSHSLPQAILAEIGVSFVSRFTRLSLNEPPPTSARAPPLSELLRCEPRGRAVCHIAPTRRLQHNRFGSTIALVIARMSHFKARSGMALLSCQLL